MIKVIVCGYKCEGTLQKCMDSIEMQIFRDFSVHVSIDDEANRKYLLRNTVDTVLGCGAYADDILVFVDADDFLCDEDAFEIIESVYKENPELLLTYGSYCNLSNSKKGKFCGPYLDGESFRCSPWRGSHLKTMRKKLFDAIPRLSFLDSNAKWFRCCADRALMTPAMELAGHGRIRWIETVLYCYNDMNPISCWKTNRELSIRTRDYISSQQPQWMLE